MRVYGDFMSAFFAVGVVCLSFGAEQKPAVPKETTAVSRMESRTTDARRDPGVFGDYWWANRFLTRHQLVESVRGQTVDLVMLGDSIIHFWEWRHPESWRKFCAGRKVLNLGYGGDRTENVIWRLEHGELDGYVAKRVVVMIGTNNNSSDKTDPANVAKGVEKIVDIVKAKQPGAQIVLHPIFPRGNGPDSARHAAAKARNDRTNALLKEYAAAHPEIRWVDFNDKFVDASGWVPAAIMADQIHPTDAGYVFWTEALAALGPAPDVPSPLRAKIAAKHKIVGEDVWYGHRRTKFDFGGRVAWVVEPSVKPLPGTPWTWTMQWAEAFVDRTGVPDLLKRGFHHATIDLFATRMDDIGVAAAAEFQKFLVEDLGFAPKANLIGMSWGGFFSTRYAAAHPQNVAKIYYDAPLMNFGGFGKGSKGNIGPWADLGVTDWNSDPRMPVNLAEPIAKAGIPALLLYGGQDATVNPALNCELFVPRFKAAGGKIDVVRRYAFGHHPHGVDPDKTGTIVNFFAL